jgi:hypothetical protein
MLVTCEPELASVDLSDFFEVRMGKSAVSSIRPFPMKNGVPDSGTLWRCFWYPLHLR